MLMSRFSPATLIVNEWTVELIVLVSNDESLIKAHSVPQESKPLAMDLNPNTYICECVHICMHAHWYANAYQAYIMFVSDGLAQISTLF